MTNDYKDGYDVDIEYIHGNEDRKQYRRRIISGTEIWTTQEGKKIQFKDMSKAHIINAWVRTGDERLFEYMMTESFYGRRK